ncbi:MAG: HNH endonuclease [Moorellaceae bacterium]
MGIDLLWRKRRRDRKAVQLARRDRCEVCGSTWGLQVHHIKSRGSGGEDTPDNLICLCVECHTKAHNGQIPKEVLKRYADYHQENR